MLLGDGMKNISLYIPNVEDLWFREECLSDPKTMEYNAGLDVKYNGYHYDTGCIDFPKQMHESWYNKKMSNPNFYYAYIKDLDLDEFIGEVNFNKDDTTLKASMGIVINSKYRGKGYMRDSMSLLIKEAKNKGVKVLTDAVPISRESALKVFKDLGFIVVNSYQDKKFDKEEIVCEIEKNL